MHCPKCKKDVKPVSYRGTEVAVCKACGYDEREVLDQFPEERSSQKAKGTYSPYKKGGKSRTQSQ